ncbi:hypothetical protein D915_004001 [Fasciola hepatica]|uniref:Uncharacterized protein n=1 Tax=Fasciola hepatica TaxID=6192 RepID=A0A4E0S1U4_FASHE|nr:hypothetical protein D915_004001 [Fasciola hepatica]
MFSLATNRSKILPSIWTGFVHHTLCFLLLSTIILAETENIGEEKEEVIEAPRQPWLVISYNIEGPIILPCYDPSFYPFQNFSLVRQVAWSLPASLKSVTVYVDKPLKGFEINKGDNYSLVIDRTKLSGGSDISGIYQCMAFANLKDNQTHATWFLLRWAVDIFPSESMLLNALPFNKFKRGIIGSIVASLLILCAAALFKVFCYFKARRAKSHELDVSEAVSVYTHSGSGFHSSEQNGLHPKMEREYALKNDQFRMTEFNGGYQDHRFASNR